jgi:hypothetical protein
LQKFVACIGRRAAEDQQFLGIREKHVRVVRLGRYRHLIHLARTEQLLIDSGQVAA